MKKIEKINNNHKLFPNNKRQNCKYECRQQTNNQFVYDLSFAIHKDMQKQKKVGKWSNYFRFNKTESKCKKFYRK